MNVTHARFAVAVAPFPRCRSMPPCRRLSTKPTLSMFPQSNFWLNSILLPWTHLQRFLHSNSNEPQLPYHMPADWAPHRRTLMAWPDRISVERDDQLHRAWTEVASIAETIARTEPVWLFTSSANAEAANSWISSTNVTVKEADLEQLWMRDTAALFTESHDGRLVGIDCNFNYWGSKISLPKRYDATLAARFLLHQQIHRTQAPFISEGGALEFDGQGTLLATESSILNGNRNPGLTKATAERHFHNLFGITKTIWLPGSPGQGITDGHIDGLARFGPNHTVLLSRPNAAVPADNLAWRIYNEAKEILRFTTDVTNRSLRVTEIEEALTVPYASISDDEEGPATSYLNYYLPNGAVVVPQFGDEDKDGEAMRVLRGVWPDREVVGVKLDILPWMGGGVHCATMQWPLLTSEVEAGTVAVDDREDEL